MEVMGGGWVGPMRLPYFYRIHMYKCKIKIFYDTMKYKKMNDGIFKILRLHGKYFLRGFYAP